MAAGQVRYQIPDAEGGGLPNSGESGTPAEVSIMALMDTSGKNCLKYLIRTLAFGVQRRMKMGDQIVFGAITLSVITYVTCNYRKCHVIST